VKYGKTVILLCKYFTGSMTKKAYQRHIKPVRHAPQPTRKTATGTSGDIYRTSETTTIA